VAAVDEDEQLNAPGAALIEERVERGADGATGVEDVVREDDVTAVDVEANVTLFDDGARTGGGEVVAVEADVEDSGVDGGLLDGLDELGEALGERHAAALDADEAEVGAAVVALDDLVGEANEGALDLGGGHEAALLAKAGIGGRLSGFGGGDWIAHGLPLMISADGRRRG